MLQKLLFACLHRLGNLVGNIYTAENNSVLIYYNCQTFFVGNLFDAGFDFLQHRSISSFCLLARRS